MGQSGGIYTSNSKLSQSAKEFNFYSSGTSSAAASSQLRNIGCILYPSTGSNKKAYTSGDYSYDYDYKYSAVYYLYYDDTNTNYDNYFNTTNLMLHGDGYYDRLNTKKNEHFYSYFTAYEMLKGRVIPMVYLKNNLVIQSGSGTIQDPYTLGTP